MSENAIGNNDKVKAPKMTVPVEVAAEMLDCSVNHTRKLITIGKLRVCPSSRHKQITLSSLLPLVGLDSSVLYKLLADYLSRN